MKQVKVVAAVIIQNGCVLATQRGYGEFKDGWEFPGGKVEAEESEEQALIREIREELNAEISVDRFLCRSEYDYDSFHLSMSCYACSLQSERFDLIEHEDALWLDEDTIDSVNWLPADVCVIDSIKRSVFAAE